MSSYIAEWVRPMLQERWGRLVEDQSEGVGSADWVHNNRPRELAQDYIALAEWAQSLERELDSTTKLLRDVGTRFADFSPKTINDQVAKSEVALRANPQANDDNGA